MTTEEVTTIKRDIGILPPDLRVVYGKYDPIHQAKLRAAVIANPPTQLDQIPEAIEAVRKAMSVEGIAMYVDSYWIMFNEVWDNLPTELKPTPTETETNHDEHSGSPVNEVDGDVQS
jgi:hypothetical protein